MDSFLSLVNELRKMPGISKKQAEKIIFYLLNNKEQKISELKNALDLFKNNNSLCNECGNISNNITACKICLDKTRQNKLIIVEQPIDIYNFENNDINNCYYHVLHGLVDVKSNFDVKLNIDNLPSRAKKFNEIIIAISPNLEGIVTSQYIISLLPKNTKITQLARGIPIGATMEYIDKITLKSALKNRKEVK